MSVPGALTIASGRTVSKRSTSGRCSGRRTAPAGRGWRGSRAAPARRADAARRGRRSPRPAPVRRPGGVRADPSRPRTSVPASFIEPISDRAQPATWISRRILPQHPARLRGLARKRRQSARRVGIGLGARPRLRRGTISSARPSLAQAVTHRCSTAVAAMELQALDEARIREPLEPSLGRAGRTGGVEPAVDLAAEQVPERADQDQHLEVQRLGLEVPADAAGATPPHAAARDRYRAARGSSPRPSRGATARDLRVPRAGRRLGLWERGRVDRGEPRRRGGPSGAGGGRSGVYRRGRAGGRRGARSGPGPPAAGSSVPRTPPAVPRSCSSSRSRGAWAGAGGRPGGRAPRGCRSPGRTLSENSLIVSDAAARASLTEAVAKYTRWANRASSWSRTAGSDHWASVCQQATVSRPADRFSAIVSAKPRFRTSGASSTLSATATRSLRRNEVLLTGQGRVEHPHQQLHQHRGVARAHHAEGPLDDQHLAAGDHAIEVHPQRLVQQHPLDRGRVQQPGQLVHRRVQLRGRHAAGVRELGADLGREERADLAELGQAAHGRGHSLAKRVALLADRQQPRGVPQRAAAVVGEHRDHRVAQVAVRRGPDVGVGEQVPERRHDVVGDHVRRRVDGERVEAARRPREVEHRARARGLHEADGGVRSVPLWVEQDQGAPLTLEVLGERRDEVARLALLDRAGHGRVLLAQHRLDRYGAVFVAQHTRAARRSMHPGRGRCHRHAASQDRNGRVLAARQMPQAGDLTGREDPAPRRAPPERALRAARALPPGRPRPSAFASVALRAGSPPPPPGARRQSGDRRSRSPRRPSARARTGARARGPCLPRSSASSASVARRGAPPSPAWARAWRPACNWRARAR